MEESIYKIIPEEKIIPKKGKMYKSSLPGLIPPTGSTFCLGNTPLPGVTNVSGAYRQQRFYQSETGVLGKPKTGMIILKKVILSPIRSNLMGSVSLDPWIEKGSLVRSQLVEVQKKIKLKPIIPKERPILGLQSTKNFIASNAIETILSNPKTEKPKEDWLKKSGYGQVPLYISQIKEALQEQYEQQEQMRQSQIEQENNKRQLLPDEEVQQIKEGLKTKWNLINEKYQKLTHMQKYDTIGLKRRKETYEAQLSALEKDMEKLNKKYVFVETTK